MNEYHKRQNAKLTQVIQNFFIKVAQVVNQARVVDPQLLLLLLPLPRLTTTEEVKINKWFNLHMSSSSEDVYKDEIRLWKQSTNLYDLPPMIIETYLDARKLGSNQTLVLYDDNHKPWTVIKGGGKKHEVVLERWLIEFDLDSTLQLILDEVPLIYKTAIILIRNIYTVARLLPAYKLARKINVINGNSSSQPIQIGVRILDGNQPIPLKGRVGLLKSIVPLYLLDTTSHINQKSFNLINTHLGSLRVIALYRKHYNFDIHDLEEVLSSHFLLEDRQPSKESESEKDIHQIANSSTVSDTGTPVAPALTDDNSKRVSVVSMSVSPCLSFKDQHSSHYSHPIQNHHILHLHTELLLLLPQPVSQRSSIQPFRIGSISNSPPPQSLLERRFLVTSNKLTSNASLVAMLRNQRASASSSNTLNIPIVATTPTINTSFPRSVLSLHADELPIATHTGASGPQEIIRFLSLFGSRALRRFLSTSMNKQGSLLPQGSIDLQVSVASLSAPLSGIYIDDDISDFVKMIDSKNDLRFMYTSQNQDHHGGSSSAVQNSGFDSPSRRGLSGQTDTLSRFQQLRLQHQQLSESVSNLIMLHSTSGLRQTGSGDQQSLHFLVSRKPSRSRSRSRTLLHSQASPPGLLENQSHIPLIHSRLRDETRSQSGHTRLSEGGHYTSVGSLVGGSGTGGAGTTSGDTTSVSGVGNLQSTPSRGQVLSTTTSSSNTGPPSAVQALYSTNNLFLRLLLLPAPGNADVKEDTPVERTKKEIRYENVFEDDDDDLLFTMSDMNLNK